MSSIVGLYLVYLVYYHGWVPSWVMVTKRDKRAMLLEKFSICHEDEEKIQNDTIISGFRFGGL